MTDAFDLDWMTGGPSWLAPELGSGLKFCCWRQHRVSGKVEWIEVAKGFTGDPRQVFADADPATIGTRRD